MSTVNTGIKAYVNALSNFDQMEEGIRKASSNGGSKGSSFTNVLDQSLIRDTVDKGESFGAHADFIKSQVPNTTPAMNPNSFSDTIANGVNKLNALQESKAAAIDEFASGQSQNVHELMITLQKASVAMSLTSAVRSKVLEAYKDLKSIQF